MNATTFLECLGCGLVGIIFHTMLKIRSLRKRSIKANLSFSFKDYFIEDWFSILISVAAVFIFVLILPELIAYRPGLQNWTVLLFISVGWMGSSILQAFFSKTEKRLLEVIDIKTNIADRILSDTDGRDEKS